jgi:carbon monoxide dehydrogenase subunit G
MATFSSNKVAVPASSNDIFNFLTDLNNLQKLMPGDKIDQWQSDAETCSFQIKGLAKIGMKLDSTEENKKIHIVSNGKNPFDFTLDIHLNEQGASTESQLIFDGNMNAFMKMMAEKPLTNFFNLLADNLKAHFA